jgi:iron(III) transport system ATP-binding protein
LDARGRERIVSSGQPPALRISRVDKRFGDCHAVRDAHLTVEAGQIAALIGPSGCGKSTLLRLIAGLEQSDKRDAQIDIGGRSVAALPPEQRRVGLVFQDYALFPHMTVADNVAFGLNRMSSRDRDARADELLGFVRLSELSGRYPHELSGGQQQRVALARALAPQPDILLFDEPFSNLDHTLRVELREETRELLKTRGVAALFVTHDREEALSLADMLAVMDNGMIVQTGSPREVYAHPATPMAARLLGEINIVPAHAEGAHAISALGTLALAAPAQGAVHVMLRPETLHVRYADDGCATIEHARYFGHDQLLGIRFDNGDRVLARLDGAFDAREGDRVQVSVDPAVSVTATQAR